jgi:ketosteroid isomerase-like protein
VASTQPTTAELERLTRRTIDAYIREDFAGVTALYREDVVWDSTAIGLGVYEGREAVRTLFEDWMAAFDDFSQTLETFHHAGNGVTVAVYRQRSCPKGSTGHVEFTFALVTTWTDGLVERVVPFTDLEEARAVADQLAAGRT